MFLISESTIPEDTIRGNIILYDGSSQQWKDHGAKVVNWNVVSSHIKIDDLNDAEMRDYTLLLLARWVVGLKNDMADRNYLKKDGRIYGVDEEARGPTDFKELSEKNKERVRAYLEDHFNSVFEVVSKWKDIGGKYDTIIDKKKCKRLFA